MALLDKYYTNREVAEACVASLFATVTVRPDDLLVEPSAGSGSFVACLRARHANVAALDLEPDGDGIDQGDFLDWAPPALPPGSRIHVVGNPPFGYKSKDANKFVRHAATFAATVAFILSASWSKPWCQTAFPPHFHLIHSQPLDAASFHLRNGHPKSVPCVWQVWARLEHPRKVPSRDTAVRPVGFHLARKDETPTLMIKRAGSATGKVDRYHFRADAKDKTARNHCWFYIVPHSRAFEAAIVAAQDSMLSFKAQNVGPRSLATSELIEALNARTCLVNDDSVQETSLGPTS